jgi:hypothetical protein
VVRRPLDDGNGADPVLVEQPGRGEGVGQLPGAPGDDVAAFGVLDLADLADQVGSGDDLGRIPQRDVDRSGGDDVLSLVIALT